VSEFAKQDNIENEDIKFFLEKNYVRRSLLSNNIPPQLFLKVDSFLSDKDYEIISKVSLETKIDGIIIGGCVPTDLKESKGGIGGSLIKDQAMKSLKTVYWETKGRIPLVSSGGIMTGEDVYERIEAGATLV